MMKLLKTCCAFVISIGCQSKPAEKAAAPKKPAAAGSGERPSGGSEVGSATDPEPAIAEGSTATTGAAPPGIGSELASPPPPPPPPPGAGAGAVKITWLGTAGLYVTDGATSFFVDPFVSRYGLPRVLARLPLESNPELVQEWAAKTGAPRGTSVIVTHSHFDHALDAPAFAAQLGGKLIGSGSTVFVGLGAGLKADQMQQVKAGEKLVLGAFSLRWIGSCHGPQFAGIELWSGNIEAPLEQPTAAHKYKGGDHFTLVVEHPSARFMHQSSACALPNMYAGTAVDTVFLGIAARVSTLELVDPILKEAGAKRLVPFHHDDFFQPLSEPMAYGTGTDVEEFFDTLKTQRPEVVVTNLTIGSSWQHP